MVEVSKEHLRPAEVDVLIGDASRARRELGFGTTVAFEQPLGMMVQRDIERMA